MNKKTYITIFIALVVTLVVLIGYYFISPSNPTEGGGGLNTFKNFFPFGGDDFTENTPTEENNTNNENTENPINNVEDRLRKLSSEPVSGAGTLDTKAGTVVRYIEKATGHIFEVELFSPRQGRISNTTIPKVYDAVWGNKNDSLISRYLKEDDETIDTFSLTVKETSTTTENTITGIAFPGNISDVSVFGSSVFYIEETSAFSNGYISNFSGGNKKLIWNSPIKELLSQHVNSSTVALTTKPEENTDGFLYFVNTANATNRKVIGNIKGLSTLVSSDASKVLYLDHGNGVSLNIYDISKKTYERVTPETFPEKCVWGTKVKTVMYCAVPKESIQNSSLTMWYKGLVQHNDDIWKFDLINKTSDVLVNLSSESNESIDVIKPILTENEQYLVFINKRDNSLWSLDLTK